MRAKQRVMNRRTTISLTGKIERKARCKCNTKKYPLYRLAISPLELLDRKHYEMHRRAQASPLRLRHFLVTFFCCRKKVTGCRATPDDLDPKTQPNKVKTQNITLLL